MHRVTIEDLLKAGAHFGHLTSRWHPNFEPYIFVERNDIHIIDLKQTQKLLDEAAAAVAEVARQGEKILFVGTKKQGVEVIRDHADECAMPYVVERWLGGMLTNFQTIRRSIRRMEMLNRMEEDGTLDKLKKKERLMKLRERDKLERTLSGIQHMVDLPGAIFVCDIKREDIAVKEANKLDIPVIAMVDSNCDPERVDHVIPVNDDAQKSIDLITGVIANAVQEGKQRAKADEEAEKAKQQAQEEAEKAEA